MNFSAVDVLDRNMSAAGSDTVVRLPAGILLDLDDVDLELVGGGVVPGPLGAVSGGIMGGAAYFGQSLTTGNWSRAEFATAVVGGAFAGFFTGPATFVQAAAGTYFGFWGGAVGGSTYKTLEEVLSSK